MKKIVAVVTFALFLACSGDAAQSDRGSASVAATTDDRPVVLFLGTSLTAGLGLAADQAYPALIQQKVDSAGLRFRVVNAGSSGETSAGGLRRIDWLLRAPVAVLVIELGANDGLRGQDVEALRANLLEIIDRSVAAYPDITILLAAMEAPPNMGAGYTGEFRRIFPEVAEEKGIRLIPFLLTGVAGIDSLNQADGIHPTAAGHRIVAANVWAVLEDVLADPGEDRGEE